MCEDVNYMLLECEIPDGMYENKPFLRAVEFVLEHEGYISNHPRDPGLLTVWGVSQKSFPDWAVRLATMEKEDSREMAKVFYFLKVWKGSGVENYPFTLYRFDCAVLSEDMFLQSKRLKTLDEIHQYRLDYQAKLVEKHPKLSCFLTGWNNRAKDAYNAEKNS